MSEFQMATLYQVGLGSGGIVALDLAARDPRIQRVILVEPDIYLPHNVERHVFPADQVGRLKVELAREWLQARRPDLTIETHAVDLLDPAAQAEQQQLVAQCDVGQCAVDNEQAKFHFCSLFRAAKKPWTLGEVLSGGIAGWVHRFWPGGPCYGCVASHLQRETPADPAAAAPDYSSPDGPHETRIPAGRASISATASLQAVLTLQLLQCHPGVSDFTSLLLPLQRVDGVFDDPFRTYRLAIARRPDCLLCSGDPLPAVEDLDAALDAALARLGHD